MTARRPKILLLSFAFVLVVVPAAHCQSSTPPPTPPAPLPALAISGETTISEGQLMVLSLTGGQASCVWFTFPEMSEFDAGQTVALTGLPGQYTIFCVASNHGTLFKYRVTGTINPAIQPVPPGPIPPTPAPAPTAKAAWAVAIFDTTQQSSLSSGQLGIYTSQTLTAALEGIGVNLKRLDINEPLIQDLYKAEIGSQALPLLILLDGKGNMISTGPLPANETALIAMVKTPQTIVKSRIE